MNNAHVWINAGYELFAREGLEGLPVERMARILSLNKSGFYHYFGTRDIYFELLMNHHYHMVDLLIDDIGKIRTFDPGYLQVMVNHPVTVLATMQLVKNRHIKLFDHAYSEVKHKINGAIVTLWSDYLGVSDRPELALRYFEMTQALFYTRVTYHNLNYEFLRQVALEAKEILDDLVMSELSAPAPQIMKSEFLDEVEGIHAQMASR